MLVTDRHATRSRDLIEMVSLAVEGGVGLVQVREKDLEDAEVEALINRLKARLPAGIAIVVNDRPDLARALEIGLHLPAHRGDADVSGIHLVGMSIHDEAEAEVALDLGVHYLVAGTIFPTASKPGHPGAGPPLIQRLTRVVDPTPLYAIGGITPENAAVVLEAGAYGVAVRSGILSAPDVKAAAAALTSSSIPPVQG